MSLSRSICAFLFLAAVVTAGAAPDYHPQWLEHSSSSASGSTGIGTADFNGDGRPDVATRDDAHRVSVFLTQADGKLGSRTVVHYGTSLTGMVVADATGDGAADIIVAGKEPNAITVLPSNGDGTFGEPLTSLVEAEPGRIVAADFNGDGRIDLATRTSAVTIYSGDGAGRFTSIGTTAVPAGFLIAAGDIDADGRADLAIGFWDATPHQIRFGRGDGTFDPAVEIGSSGATTTRVIVADLDADGDLEILFSDYYDNTVTVVVNNGSRTFAAPASYLIPLTQEDQPEAWPSDIAAADVNGDGKTDLVAALQAGRALGTFIGNGNGTLRPVIRVQASGASNSPRDLVLADFTGDGRPDVGVTMRSTVNVFANAAGDVLVGVQLTYPTITVGQTAESYVSAEPRTRQFWEDPRPVASGTLTLAVNGVDAETRALTHPAKFEISALPLGANAITARYGGDDSYRASERTATQNVIAEKTTTVLTSSSGGRAVEYGEPWSLSATVTSEIDASVHGTMSLYTADAGSETWRAAPSWHPQGLLPGTYRYQAAYGGNIHQPPSRSEVVTQVVKKATTQTTTFPAGQQYAYHSNQTVRVDAVTQWQTTVEGTVRLYNGSVLLGTTTSSGTVTLALPVGVHYLHAVYVSNDRYETSKSDLLRHIVMPDDRFVIDATANGGTITVRGFYPVAGFSGYYKIHRRKGREPWLIYTSGSASWSEPNVQPGAVYAYRMEAYDWSNQFVASSNIDVAVTMAFTDDPLLPGTTAKAVHLDELIAATNILLAGANIEPIAIGGSGPGKITHAEHLLRLRIEIDRGRAAIGATQIPWLDVMQPGVRIRAQHTLELRDALR